MTASPKAAEQNRERSGLSDLILHFDLRVNFLATYTQGR